MGRLDDKVVLITGAARGQGRSHAEVVAAEGADVIAIDVCADIEGNTYTLSRPEDLRGTVEAVRRQGRRAVGVQADVRDPATLHDGVQTAVAELGRLDVVVANAGICPLGPDVPFHLFNDVLATNFNGVVYTVSAAMPHLSAGASIIAIGSLVAFTEATRRRGAGPGDIAYWLSKRFVTEYVHSLAGVLARKHIRVNAIHPNTCGTDMVLHPATYKIMRPELEAPTLEDALGVFASLNAMDVPWIEPRDVSAAVVFLASDESRYITGTQLRVDAGGFLNSSLSPAG